MHNQATFGLMTADAEEPGGGRSTIRGVKTKPNLRIDGQFPPIVAGRLEWMPSKGWRSSREWGTTPGDPANYSDAYYKKVERTIQ